MRLRQFGFTLVELLVVMVVMGVLASIVAPSLTNQQSLDEIGFRDELKGMLRYARQVAVVQQQQVCVIVSNASSQAIVVYGAAGTCSVAGFQVASPQGDTSYVVPIPATVTVTSPNLLFMPTGSLSAAANASVVIGTMNPAMTVDHESGAVY